MSEQSRTHSLEASSARGAVEMWHSIEEILETHESAWPAAEPVVRKLNAPAPVANEDETMGFPTGEARFRVQGIVFRIPKALLHQHCEGLSSMFDMDDSSGAVVDLQDSLEGFTEFRRVLFTPFNSCVGGKTIADPSDLSKILALLTFAHKYCAIDIETRALTMANTFVGDSGVLRAVPDVMVPRILEVTRLIEAPQLKSSARNAFLELMRTQPQNPRLALRFGKHLQDRRIQGAAYLAILRESGEAMTWKTDPTISPSDKSKLSFGLIRCAWEWQHLQSRIVKGGLGCDDASCQRIPYVVELAVANQDQIPLFDIPNHLALYQKANKRIGGQHHTCFQKVADQFQAETISVQDTLHELFFDEISQSDS